MSSDSQRQRRAIGSIRPKGPGRWELRIQGTSRIVHADSEAAAQNALGAWIEEIGLQRPAAATLGELLEAYYAHTARTRSDRSNENVRSCIDRYLLPHAAGWDIGTMGPGDLERLYERLRTSRGQPLSAQTIRHVHYIVLPALGLARRWGWVDRNVAEDVELGAMRRTAVRPPQIDQVVALIDAAEPDLALFLDLLIATGARRGEVAGLQRGDIAWAIEAITINRALTEAKLDPPVDGRRRDILVVPPKTDRSQRTITVPLPTLGRLQHHLDRLVEEHGLDERPERWVFPDLHRDLAGAIPVRPGTWSSRFRRLAKTQGVEVRLHSLRHLHISLLLQSGIDLIDASFRAGHSRTSTTADVYGHVVAGGADRRAADIIAAELSRPARAPRRSPDGPGGPGGSVPR